MFYTGRNKNPDIKWIQKIGLAISDDLINWKKHENNPILEADNKIYEIKNEKNAIGKVGAWRDPYVFQDPITKKYYMIIAARKKGNATEYNGCIAITESDDLLNWNLFPPLIAPGVYDEMEVPQMIIHNGIYYLFFSTHAANYKPAYAKKVGAFGGRHCYYSKNLFDYQKLIKYIKDKFDPSKLKIFYYVAPTLKDAINLLDSSSQDNYGHQYRRTSRKHDTYEP